MDLDSAVDTCKQLNLEPVALGKCTLICSLFPIQQYCPLECLPKWLSNDYLHSTDCCNSFRFDQPHHGINNVLYVRSSHFRGLVWQCTRVEILRENVLDNVHTVRHIYKVGNFPRWTTWSGVDSEELLGNGYMTIRYRFCPVRWPYAAMFRKLTFQNW